MEFKTQFNNWVDIINAALDKYVVEKECPEKSIYSAMRYSLTAGGKRLRPVLSLAVCEMLGGNIEDIMPYACALEMIHTYSLIHDDLPAMDNDDYRRGRLTNHKVYGEARAILAGDALLNYSFEIMSEDAMLKAGKTMAIMKRIKAMNIIAKASGVTGMIGGQVVDMESEGKQIGCDILEYMHKCKTGAIIKAAVLSAAVLSDASGEDLQALEAYADNIGLAFQIKDDILDIEGDFKALGKPIGSDIANGKSTFVSIYGLEGTKKMLETTTQNALDSIKQYEDKAGFLKALTKYLMERES